MVVDFTLKESTVFNVKLNLSCSIDRTYKFYYGGAQKRPDAPYSRPIRNPKGHVISHVGEGNRKDVRNAVDVAHKAAPG